MPNVVLSANDMEALTFESLDASTSSSDAGDILIRSTSIRIPRKGCFEKQNITATSVEPRCNDKVKISVKRLHEVAPPSMEVTTETVSEQVRICVPPALPANKPLTIPSRVRRPASSDMFKVLPGDRKPKKGPGEDRDSQVTSADVTKPLSCNSPPEGSRLKEQDVLISQYARGKEAVRAVLKQRSHGAPLRQEVKVQLLNQGGSSTTEAPQASEAPLAPTPSPGDQGASAAAAAVTAAALAATAPLLKAQSDLDSRLSHFTDDLRRLQEEGMLLGRKQEDRSGELEQQLHALTQQRLQHLERIQEQQLELQNRLLGSALDVVTSHVPAHSSTVPAFHTVPLGYSTGHTEPQTTEAAGDLKCKAFGRARQSTPETPAPRRFVPMPMSRNTKKHSNMASQGASVKPGNGRLLEQILNNPKSPGSRTQPMGGKKVAIATAVCQPEPSSAGKPQHDFLPSASSCSRAPGQAWTAVREPSNELPDSGCLQGGPPSAPSSVMLKAAGMLQDLGRLKAEMQTLVQESRKSPPPCLENQTKAASVSSGRVQPGDAPLGEGREPAQTSSGQSAAGTLPPPPRVSSPTPQTRAPKPLLQTLLLQNQPPPSMFEDAGRVLRRIQHHRRVLEENLEAILRAKDGEALHCQLEALSCNRDASEGVRIKKTVDAWISTLSKEIQAEIAREGFAARQMEHDKGSSSVLLQPGGGRKDDRLLEEAKGRTQSGDRTAGRKPFQRVVQGHSQNVEAQHKQPSRPLKSRGPHQLRLIGVSKPEKDDEEYLMKVYGKALFDGHRRTLKKSPYLRYSSPSPKSKPQRPKVVESVKGVKVKSAKTQTSLLPEEIHTVVNEPQYIFSPTRGEHNGLVAPQTPLEGLLIPMAIPLGQPRVEGGPPQPSRVIISHHPFTMTTSIPPSQPKPSRKPNVVVTEVQSVKKKPVQLQVQVLPNVDVDSVPSASPFPSPPPPPPPKIQAVEQAQEEAEYKILPGSDYLAFVDISQEPDEEPRDMPIQLNGFAEPPAALYHGPAFPPQPPRPPAGTESILGIIQQRETLENRLVDWVEQQLMARMIHGMYPQHVHTEQASLSEPEEGCLSGSDIVEAAGGSGLQLFVDAGVPVDSALIRQFVTDALAETVTLMLGQREEQARPTAPALALDVPATTEVVPTPVPTPVPSPRESPVPPARVSPSPSTPEPSEQGSAAESSREMLAPSEPQGTGPPESEQSPVATPAVTPVPSPPQVATPTAPPSVQSVELVQHSNPWGDAELPLEEEVPHCESEEQQQNHRPETLSVAKDEEPVSLVFVSPPAPPKHSTPPPRTPTPPPLRETPPPASCLSSEDSSSSPSITETDVAGRHISEGELLLSSGHMIAARALAEEGLPLPALNASLSSSLHGVLDIDYDPPSEGQVVRRPRIPHHRDPVLSLLAKMDQGPVALQEVPHHLEGFWDEETSLGELSEGQRPRLTAIGERILTGHSLLLDHTGLSRPGAGLSPDQGSLSSPGQLTLSAGLTLDSVQGSHHPVTISDLEASPMVLPHTQPIRVRSPEAEHDGREGQASDPPAPAHRSAPILVKQYQDRPEETEEQDQPLPSTSRDRSSPRTMLVMLPSTRQDRVSASISTVETDSSENDVF
ncbi:hypothetical protein AGOR_G00108020 [Albula goreensis]|uniref:Protein TALPID3 n=1 Tax=Albula goreensis TaxID=1534307 RepID=A0A8T3DFL8_9TELE|nr:hypothetical protein AGOR_G00108020 [Albula goreensis]